MCNKDKISTPLSTNFCNTLNGFQCVDGVLCRPGFE